MVPYEEVLLMFGAQPETDLICKPREGCLMWSAETFVDTVLFKQGLGLDSEDLRESKY